MTNEVLTQEKPQRRYDIDMLRVLSVLLLIYFHTSMIFAAWETWHVRNDELSIVAQWAIMFIHQWHMPLLFLLAGASTYFALHFRTSQQYVGERFKRLFVPFLFGVLVIIPPQVYIERISTWMSTRTSPINFEGTFFQFYPRFFECCYSDGNLTWHHLWFIIYLVVYSLAALPLFIYFRKPAGQSRIASWADTLGRGANIFWLAVPIAVIEVTMRHRFPHWQDLIHDWTNHAHFMTLFVYGYVLFANGRFQTAITRNKKPALFLGILCTSGYFAAIYAARADVGDATLVYVAQMTLRAFSEWGWIVALLGYGRQYLNKRTPFLRYASEIAYPFYILHQTVIVIIGYYMLQWPTGATVKYILISTTALIVTVLLCEAVKQTNITRFLFGMNTPKQKSLDKASIPFTMWFDI